MYEGIRTTLFYEGPPLKGTTLMYEETTVVYEGPPFFYRHFAGSLSLSFLMKEPSMKDHLSFETTLKIKQKWFHCIYVSIQTFLFLVLCPLTDLFSNIISLSKNTFLHNPHFFQKYLSQICACTHAMCICVRENVCVCVRVCVCVCVCE